MQEKQSALTQTHRLLAMPPVTPFLILPEIFCNTLGENLYPVCFKTASCWFRFGPLFFGVRANPGRQKSFEFSAEEL